MNSAHLVLADGSIFAGEAIGGGARALGEVVFNTSMTGYQEMLTDPSYAGQILVLTYPMIGNYGFHAPYEESSRVQPSGLAVRDAARHPSHPVARGTLDDFLREREIPGIEGIDTRALTRRIRRSGVMAGAIVHGEAPEAALEHIRAMPSYDDVNWVDTVSSREGAAWPREGPTTKRVALLDVGVKHNIMRSLSRRGCEVQILPSRASVEDVLAYKPDGIVISPGPGDPRLLDGLTETARGLIGRVPILGICLGHQLIARALGAGTFKLPFGHRGGNHPVKDCETGRVTITAQNHGYAVDPAGLSSGAFARYINLNDDTVEGLAMTTEPVITIQYHAEASPGPLDSDGVFDQFVALMEPGGK